MRVINLVDVDTGTERLDDTKALNTSPLTITVGGFFVSTLRTLSVLTMNKTKKRAYKRSQKLHYSTHFWKFLNKLTGRVERVMFVRDELDVSFSEAREFLQN